MPPDKGVCGILFVLLWVFGWDLCLHWGFFSCFVFGGVFFLVVWFGLVWFFVFFLIRVFSALGKDLGLFFFRLPTVTWVWSPFS